MKQVAKIFLLNHEKKLLMVLRDNKPEIAYPNYWSEIGGEIEKGESPIEALKREIDEEIICKIYDIEFVGEIFILAEDCKLILFKGKVIDRLEDIKLYEGQKLGLFEFQELENLLIPPFVREFIIKNKEKIFK